MIDVIIIGTGNVSFHFSKVISNRNGLRLIGIYGRERNIPDYFNKNISYKKK